MFTKFWKKWKKIAYKAMELQARIILFAVYFTILLPLGLWYKNTEDIFKTKNSTSNWRKWPYSETEKSITNM